jgi:hypothetical protein
LGLNTSTSFTLEEIEELLAKVATRTPKVQLVIRSKGKEPVPSPSSNSLHGFASIDEAVGYASKLNSYNNKGVKNTLPKDSLGPGDFVDRTSRELFARACSVANNLGYDKIVSRIASRDSGLLKVSGANNLREWWGGASSSQRFMLLCKSRHFSSRNEEGGVRVSKAQLKAMFDLQCPFRNAEAQMGRPEAESSAEETSDEETFVPGPSAKQKRPEEGVLLKW